MSRRGVLAQQLNAIESLASVDTICVDKTGTLTEAKLRVVEIVPAAGVSRTPPTTTRAAGLAAGEDARRGAIRPGSGACENPAPRFVGRTDASRARSRDRRWPRWLR
jgi:cation-transporting P-type ATPase E